MATNDNPEILTDDEELLHVPRWEGGTQSVPAAIRSLAKVHQLASDEANDEAENWRDFVDELTVVIQQLQGEA